MCTSCHNPHSSGNEKLLTATPPDLCYTCHDEKQFSGRHVMAGFSAGDNHPVKGKPDPSKSGRELSCTSCHAAHSSNMKFLFTNETASPDNLCLMCHKKVIVRP
jgi:predicted CXXCH cytochrome family protein